MLNFSSSGFCFSQDINGISSSASNLFSSMDVEEEHSRSLFCNLYLLKNKLIEVQSMVSIFFNQSPSSENLISLESLIQEITISASNTLFQFQQQIALKPPSIATLTGNNSNNPFPVLYSYDYPQDGSTINFEKPMIINDEDIDPQGITEGLYIAEDTYNNNNHNSINGNNVGKSMVVEDRDVIEVDAIELLAKYTHYCPLCEKGFKRDANLRMHMRAHGDEYKSSVALSNPVKDNVNATVMKKYYYSCPQEGCRWNKNHPMFQPLKSMICAKNHYRRSHCPKMYVCKRCNHKQFAVLSDLRTHEKHCGDVKWLCSCGTNFSRKEKLMGHVATFIGHNPVPNGSGRRG